MGLRLHIAALFIFLNYLVMPSNSFAVPITCTSVINLLSTTTATGNSANMVDLPTCTASCSIAGYYRAYIDFADKELYAFALAAKIKGGTYAIRIDTQSPVEGNGTHGFVPCKILSIW